MDDGVTVEVTIVLPGDTEGKPFGVPQQPGGFMVPLRGGGLCGGDPEGDP